MTTFLFLTSEYMDHYSTVRVNCTLHAFKTPLPHRFMCELTQWHESAIKRTSHIQYCISHTCTHCRIHTQHHPWICTHSQHTIHIQHSTQAYIQAHSLRQ